jgi:similar to stage IV sporulation protein
MLLNAWQYAKGYVTVEVTGLSVERFLNMAMFRGAYVWDVARIKNGITMRISIPGFKMLKGCARKTNCKVRIINKNGVPFIIHRYRRRKVLWGGAVFFMLGLYALSSFVWRIDVIGRERIEQDEILSFCENYGLRVGALKYRVSHRKLQKDLQIHFPDIAWADVYTKGTRTTITISETIPAQRVIDKKTACHIVAAKDGLITGMVTGAGRPLVRRHDVVKQGELLVSGALEMESDLHGVTTQYVHAYAEIWAKRFTPVQFFIPFDYTEKAYTGHSVTRYELQLLFAGGKRIALPALNTSPGMDSYDKITQRWQPGVAGDYPLPFIWVATRYDEFVPVTRTRDADAAKALADRMLTGRILREFDFAADIIGKEVTFRETPQGLHVEALITTNERIDAAVPINTNETPAPPLEDAAEAFGFYD